MSYLGIDIGGTAIKYGILNEKLEVEKSWRKDTGNWQDMSAFYDYLCKDIDTREIDLIGIAAPGIIEEKTQKVMSRAATSIAVMQGSRIGAEVSKRLQKPVYSMNDAKAAAFCEIKKGSGYKTTTSAYWLIGTGIGGCLSMGDQLINGKDGLAGEFSHIPIKTQNGSFASLGDAASIPALVKLYKQLSLTKDTVSTGKEVCERFLKGDKSALEAMDLWCETQIQGFLILTSIYNPEVICIGGGISQETWFIELLQRKFQEANYRFSHLITTKIVKCKYGNDANLIGAVLNAIEAKS